MRNPVFAFGGPPGLQPHLLLIPLVEGADEDLRHHVILRLGIADTHLQNGVSMALIFGS